MASASAQAEFEAALDGWPRRLLHVPSMTSYRWNPGNVYGSYRAPLYNAITYTWGRWMLRTPEDQPHVLAVDIKGVDWDIPRIDPRQFSREEFVAVIVKATEPVGVEKGSSQTKEKSPNRDYNSSSVEFLWLDVACIDQRPSSPDSAAEIGRQAEIFRGAKCVFVWLASFTGSELVEILRNISIPSPFYPDARLHRPFRTIQDHLEKLCADPWFSSLWTLQEAFLRQDAAFLSRDGELAGDTLPPSDQSLYFAVDLKGLIATCRDMVWFIYQEIGDKTTATTINDLQRHQDLIKRIGISGFQTRNQMTTFISSGQRTTSREPDRIYGIQQIFGFRLGSSTLGASQCTFTRQDLEVQFGREVVVRFPVMSQLFVSQKPVEFGDGWRISPGSTIENGVLDNDWSDASENPEFAEESRPIQTCELTTKTVDNHVWGYFSGKMIRFVTLLNCTKALTVELQRIADEVEVKGSEPIEEPGESEEPGEPINLLLLSLDVSEFTAGWPTEILPSGHGREDNFASEDERSEWLAAAYPEKDLIVVGLVFLPIRAFGLILLREHIGSESGPRLCWRRLGYCEWWMTNLLDDVELRPGSSFEPGILEGWETKYGPCLQGSSDDWKEAEGLLG